MGWRNLGRPKTEDRAERIRLKKLARGPSFWSEVAELKAMIAENVRAGKGRKSLILAVAEQTLLKNTVQAENKEPVKPKLTGMAALKEHVSQLPPGSKVQMSAEEYRRLVDGKD